MYVDVSPRHIISFRVGEMRGSVITEQHAKLVGVRRSESSSQRGGDETNGTGHQAHPRAVDGHAGSEPTGSVRSLRRKDTCRCRRVNRDIPSGERNRRPLSSDERSRAPNHIEDDFNLVSPYRIR